MAVYIKILDFLIERSGTSPSGLPTLLTHNSSLLTIPTYSDLQKKNRTPCGVLKLFLFTEKAIEEVYIKAVFFKVAVSADVIENRID